MVSCVQSGGWSSSLFFHAQRGLEDQRIQKEANMFRKEDSMRRVRDLLKEYPWLWAVKQSWGKNVSVHFQEADSTRLDTGEMACDFFNSPLQTVGYAHLVSEGEEQVIKIVLEGTGRTWTEAMLYLATNGISDLAQVKHLACENRAGVWVYRAPRGSSLFEVAEDSLKDRARAARAYGLPLLG